MQSPKINKYSQPSHNWQQTKQSSKGQSPNPKEIGNSQSPRIQGRNSGLNSNRGSINSKQNFGFGKSVKGSKQIDKSSYDQRSMRTNQSSIQHKQIQSDVQSIRKNLIDKYGNQFDSLINTEILNAVNNIKSAGNRSISNTTGDGQSEVAGSVLAAEEIELRVARKIEKRQKMGGHSQDQSPEKVNHNGRGSHFKHHQSIDGGKYIKRSNGLNVEIGEDDNLNGSMLDKMSPKTTRGIYGTANVQGSFDKPLADFSPEKSSSKVMINLRNGQNHSTQQNIKEVKIIDYGLLRQRGFGKRNNLINTSLNDNENYTQDFIQRGAHSILNSLESIEELKNQSPHNAITQPGQIISQISPKTGKKFVQMKAPNILAISHDRDQLEKMLKTAFKPQATLNKINTQRHIAAIGRNHNSSCNGSNSIQKSIKNNSPDIFRSQIQMNTIGAQRQAGPTDKEKFSIENDVKEHTNQKMSNTLKSSLLPYAYAIQPSNWRAAVQDPKNSDVKKFIEKVHEPLQQTVAKGQYASFFSPKKIQENTKASALNNSLTGIVQTQMVNSQNFCQSRVSDHRSNNRSPYGEEDSNVNCKSPIFSVRNDMGSKFETIDQQHIFKASKFDLGNTLNGPAIGGPSKKTQISMWDMMTLYDSQKKRIEDKVAFKAVKQQQKEMRDFYDQQVDYKNKLRQKDLHDRNQELEQIKSQAQQFSAYEQNYERSRRKFLSQLQTDNMNYSVVHKRLQTLQARNDQKNLNNHFLYCSKEWQNANQVSSDRQKTLRQLQLKQHLEEINLKMQLKEMQKQKELQDNLDGLNQRERDFQIRDQKLADHIKKICDRDEKIFATFNQPNQITHSKQVNALNHHVEELNNINYRKAVEKERKQEEENNMKKMYFLSEMIKENQKARIRNVDNIVKQQLNTLNRRKFSSQVGRIDKFVAPQVAQLVSEKNIQIGKNLQAKQYMIDLQKQIQDKRLRDESQRLYLDNKQLATSGTIMQKVNPELFQKAVAGSPEKLIEGEKLLKEQCIKLNHNPLITLHPPNELRGQRFKD